MKMDRVHNATLEQKTKEFRGSKDEGLQIDRDDVQVAATTICP